MTTYILQTICFQMFFLLVYEFFLKRETFFNCNRAYLLVTPLLSLFLPFLKFDIFKTNVPQEYISQMPTVVSETIPVQSIAYETINVTETVVESTWSWSFVIYTGMVLAGLFFIFKLYKLRGLYLKNHHSNFKDFKIITLKKSREAFSFLKNIFLGERIKDSERKSIIDHELIHIKQKHSLDLIYFELLRIVFWFNPLMYVYQYRMIELHEFIADSKSVTEKNKHDHYQSLLNQMFQTNNLSFVNQFFSRPLIKKRITMLNKKNSKQIKLLKYALLCPLILGMLFYVSCEQENIKETGDEISQLDQYSYSLKKGETMSPKKQAVHNSYEAFLKDNPEYVSWVDYDFSDEAAHFSIHLKDEEVPIGFHEVTLNFPNGEKYKSYIDFGIKNSKAIVKLSIDDADETILPKMAIRDRQNWSNKIEPMVIVARKDNLNENQYSSNFGDNEILKVENSKNQFLNKINNREVVDTQEIEVPWPVLDEVPLFAGCEKLGEEENRQCTDVKISEYIHANFNKTLAEKYNFNDDKRINVIFKIDTDGNIISVRARAKYPALENEAIRVVKSMPRFTAGKYKDKKVIVPYGLPIIFNGLE